MSQTSQFSLFGDEEMEMLEEILSRIEDGDIVNGKVSQLIVQSMILTSDSSTDNEDPVNKSYTPMKNASKKVGHRYMVSAEVASSLDRTMVSDLKATFLLASVAKALGHDPSVLVLNKESVRHSRRQHRQAAAYHIKETFDVDGPTCPPTIHWDGRILPALTGNDKVDRLAVLDSGNGIMKLFGVPKLLAGTGEVQANAVYQLIDDWQLTERIQTMCFDTTASNTGRKAGACTIESQKLQKPLLGLACRHHIHELIVARVFGLLMGTSSGPTIKLFERFSQSWNLHRQIQPCMPTALPAY